jgi:carboxyl-terminal processing protease
MALTTAYYYTPSGRSIQKPLSTGQISREAIAGRADDVKDYRTASGRRLHGGGGIQPDRVVEPESMTRFRMVMEGSGVFPQFAIDYARRNRIVEGFDVSGEVLDRFRVYLSERNIRPGLAEWSSERDWIASRLKAEIYNQAFGIERGDQVDLQRDPVVRAALDTLRR